MTAVTSSNLLAFPVFLCVLEKMLGVTIHSSETHYVCGTGGYKIMVSLGTRFSPETHFWNVKLPPLRACLLVLFC